MQVDAEQSIVDGFTALSAGRPQAALDAVTAVDADAYPRASLLRGHAHKALGSHESAEHAYRALTDSTDAHQCATGWWSLAALKTAAFTHTDASRLDALIPDFAEDGYRGLLHLTRAEIWHQAGVHDMAFEHLKAGNDLISSARPFNGEAFHSFVNELLTINAWPIPASSSDTEPAPLFIVGQPRSGTTLVEQILASHPSVDATDELTFMGHRGADLQRDTGYAAGVMADVGDMWEAMREQYLTQVAPYRDKSGTHVIDKTPENFLHVALILKVLPNARFVHVVRDPLDNIVSQYRHFFPEGREYSNSLAGLLFYWQGYLMLMRHWSALFPERIHHLHYARLVESPDAEIESLLDFCGLTRAPECFAPHETQRPVMTPSAAQVRQPINRSGLDSGLVYGGAMQDWLKDIGKLKEVSASLFGKA